MGEAVETRELRFRFVEKDISEVGDYSPFPIESTGATIGEKLDKIEEIFARASVAQFTDNTLTQATFTSGVTSGTISPRVMFETSTGLSDNYLMSGYFAWDFSPFEVYPAALPFLGDQYTETFWDAIPVTGTFRDMNGREPGLLLPRGQVTDHPQWNLDDSNEGVVTAFSWYSNSAAGDTVAPGIPIPWIEQPGPIYEQLEVSVAFTGKIGVVYGGDVGDLFHSDNRFFIEMSVIGSMPGAGVFFNAGTIDTGYSSTAATYTMRLSSGDITCPLNSTDATLSGGMVHEVVEWFPYAKGNPAMPKWDSATGVKL